ncbi:helix-turn-helix domain-containing protein [Nocardiopsis sp. LOL_012]|uniref:helix-turn-helix domain-containing protein n=1 Tax=Nocardiopsis sp. LOL_012 TaxID=3345409 RepID=UPI003A88D711
MTEKVRTEWVPFGNEVRRVREQAGLTLDQLSPRIGFAASTISKVERGTREPKREFVDKIEAVFGTNGALLRRWSDTKKALADPDWFQKSVRSEEEATEIRMWHPMLIPGFMQSPGYARVIFRDGRPFDTPEQVDELVQLRTSRLPALRQGRNPRISAVIAERVVRANVGSTGVMREQLKHLLDLGESGAVQVSVLPDDTPYHGGSSGPIKVLTTPDRATLVYADHAAGGELVTRPDRVARLAALFGDLQAWALPPATSRELIATVLGDLQ